VPPQRGTERPVLLVEDSAGSKGKVEKFAFLEEAAVEGVPHIRVERDQDQPRSAVVQERLLRGARHQDARHPVKRRTQSKGCAGEATSEVAFPGDE
jgi:hypothetical protein